MKKSLIKVGFIGVFGLIIANGQTASANNTVTPKSAKNTASPVINQAKSIQKILATQQYNKLIPYIHPSKGVRFSMYSDVYGSENDKVFSRQDFNSYLKKSKVKFTWGEKDGTGEPLIISLPQYLTTWVRAKNFNHVEMTTAQFDPTQDFHNNWGKIYPSYAYVTFHYEGTKQYEGMDWQKLTFVFDTYQDKHYLVAILNSQWTI